MQTATETLMPFSALNIAFRNDVGYSRGTTEDALQRTGSGF
jgi:hypothetical protein